MGANRIGAHRVGVWALGITLVGVAVASGVLAGPASPASAHNSVISTTPSAGAVITEQPSVFQVTTNDNLLKLDTPGAMRMQISGPTDAATPLYYGDGCTTVFGPTLEVKAQLGEPGEYTVVWLVVSTDGHTISGDFAFTWQPADGQELATGSSTPPDCGGTITGGTTQTDASTPAPTPRNAAVGDVLWIGGAVAAVILATLVTVLVVGRRKPPTAPVEVPPPGTPPAEW